MFNTGQEKKVGRLKLPKVCCTDECKPKQFRSILSKTKMVLKEKSPQREVSVFLRRFSVLAARDNSHQLLKAHFAFLTQFKKFFCRTKITLIQGTFMFCTRTILKFLLRNKKCGTYHCVIKVIKNERR